MWLKIILIRDINKKKNKQPPLIVKIFGYAVV